MPLVDDIRRGSDHYIVPDFVNFVVEIYVSIHKSEQITLYSTN